MPSIHVFVGLGAASDHRLAETAASVVDGLSGNAAFPAPPVSLVSLLAVRSAFMRAIADTSAGVPGAAAVKKEQRAALVEMLHQLSRYIEKECNNDTGVVLGPGLIGQTSSPVPGHPPGDTTPVPRNGTSEA